MRKKVIVAGHTCLDITPKFPQKEKASKLTDILSPGRLINMQGVDIHTGGAVSNTGLAMKILGADVTLMAKIGNDDLGSIVADIFGKYDASSGLISVEGERTSYTVAIAAPGFDRIFLHDPGCNDTFSFDDISAESLKDTVLFHFGYPPIMKRMYINDGDELLKIMKYVKEQGIATSMDMAFVDEDSQAGRADWNGILRKVLPYVDFFVPSVEELCWMLDREKFNSWKERAEKSGKDIVSVIDHEKDVKPIARKCMEYGAKVALIKCGAPGLYYMTADEERFLGLNDIIGIDIREWANKSGFERSYKPSEVLSGTGAGDTSIAAFLTAMIDGYDFETCIRLAAAEGASCVESYDALSGLKSLDELNNKIKSGWNKQ